MQACNTLSALNVHKKLREAKSLERENKLMEALECYGDILEVFPGNARARRGVEEIEKALATPRLEEMKILNEMNDRGDHEATLALALALLETYPTSHVLWVVAGHKATKQEQHDLAEMAFKTAVSLRPDDLEMYKILAEYYHLQEKFSDALAIYTFMLKRKPDDPNILHSRGAGYLAADLNGKAIDDFTQAIDHLEDTKENKNVELDIRLKLADAYTKEDNNDAAVEHFLAAQRLAPPGKEVIGALLHIYASRCDWSPWENPERLTSTEAIAPHLTNPFTLFNYDDSLVRQRRRAEKFVLPSEEGSKRQKNNISSSRKRLRVGYVTADLSNHATLKLFNGVLEKHDKENFEIFVYGITAPVLGSKEVQRLLKNTEHTRFLHEETTGTIIEMIRQDLLDIAVDLKGYTKGCRPELFIKGLAPVQISYLGYPGTTAIDAMDYVIADEWVIPAKCREGYSERVIYMPHSYQPNDDLTEISDEPVCRADYGLPEDAIVLCCFNNNWKITPLEFDVWMRILGKVDNAVLWLLSDNDLARSNLIKEAARRGIGTDRLFFAGRAVLEKHLARHRLADLFIDTFNYNAHTTARDALWAGLPVVTKAGHQFAARVAASLLDAVGLPDLITETVDEYEALILRLVTNPDELAKVKARLVENRDTYPLFNTERYTRHLEAAFRLAANASGNTLNDIYVPAD